WVALAYGEGVSEPAGRAGPFCSSSSIRPAASVAPPTRGPRGTLRAMSPNLARRPRAASLLLLAAVCTVLAASSCPAAAPLNNSVLPGNGEPTAGPYVVTAIDNHFHDIHPEDRNVIHADQPFVVKNAGANLHNFTVIGTQISIDLKPGQSFEWPTIGSK